ISASVAISCPPQSYLPARESRFPYCAETPFRQRGKTRTAAGPCPSPGGYLSALLRRPYTSAETVRLLARGPIEYAIVRVTLRRTAAPQFHTAFRDSS